MSIENEQQKQTPYYSIKANNHPRPPQTGAVFIPKRPKAYFSPNPNFSESSFLPHSPIPNFSSYHPTPAAPRYAPPSAHFSAPPMYFSQRAPIANPLILYAVFRGYLYGPLEKKTIVAIGQKVILQRDKSNFSDERSVKAVAFPKGPDIGHMDVMTRDALAEVLEDSRFGIRTEGVVSDFDEEVEDPPAGQFLAMVRVSLIGPVFSVSSFTAVFNEFFVFQNFFFIFPLFN